MASKKQQDPVPPVADEVPHRLNTNDLKAAISYAVTRGAYPRRDAVASDFDVLVNTKEYLLSFVAGNTYFEQFRTSRPVRSVTNSVRTMFDADKDGRVSAADYLKVYQSRMQGLDARRASIDCYLPFVGQCAFGVLCGWALGRLAHRMYRAKVLICCLGAVGYFGFQYLDERQLINKTVLHDRIEAQVRETLDVNKDGAIDRKDVEALVAAKMATFTDKLGPEVFAPGMVGIATFGLGLVRGMRWL